MIFKAIVFIAFVAGIAACTKDEAETTGSIIGLVTRGDNGEPLDGVSVSLNPGGKTATTGSDGRYEFVSLEPQQYTVQLMKGGYKTSTRRITVVAGEVASGDVQLTAGEEEFDLSVSSLTFSESKTTSSFDILNISVSKEISFSILASYPSWLSVSEKSGRIPKGGQRSIVVKKINTPAVGSEGYLTVEVAGSTKQVHVTFTAGGSGDGGGDVKEDYSSVQISQCDTRLKASVVSCQRVGSTVVFTCNLLNNGLGDVNDFRIYPPSSSSLISDGVRSKIIDDSQSDYPDATISFRGGSASSYRTIIGLLPDGVASKVVVTIGNVPGSVKKFSLIKLGVYAYPDSQYHLVNKYIDFKNVPVY